VPEPLIPFACPGVEPSERISVPSKTTGRSILASAAADTPAATPPLLIANASLPPRPILPKFTIEYTGAAYNGPAMSITQTDWNRRVFKEVRTVCRNAGIHKIPHFSEGIRAAAQGSRLRRKLAGGGTL
jgi:hypothetical protein